MFERLLIRNREIPTPAATKMSLQNCTLWYVKCLAVLPCWSHCTKWAKCPFTWLAQMVFFCLTYSKKYNNNYYTTCSTCFPYSNNRICIQTITSLICGVNIAFCRLLLIPPNVSMHLQQNLITRSFPCSNAQGNGYRESNDSSNKSSDEEDNDDNDLFVNPNHQKPTTYFETDSSDESENEA